MKVAHLTTALVLPLLAVATPGATPTTKPVVTTTVTVTTTSTSTPVSQCNTGPIQCCNSVLSSTNVLVSTLLGLLNVVLSAAAVDIPVGITCSPISILGIGGNSCTAQPVCCENNTFNGIIAIGCVPISISL